MKQIRLRKEGGDVVIVIAEEDDYENAILMTAGHPNSDYPEEDIEEFAKEIVNVMNEHYENYGGCDICGYPVKASPQDYDWYQYNKDSSKYPSGEKFGPRHYHYTCSKGHTFCEDGRPINAVLNNDGSFDETN